jgi:hypothetical protein
MSNELKPWEQGCIKCGSNEDECEMQTQYRDGSWICRECAAENYSGTGWSPSDKYE